MTEDEKHEQEAIHHALASTLPLDDGELLAGWIVIYETVSADDDRGKSGHVYGPLSMTTWRALGLIEWARRFCLRPDEDDDR